MIKRDIFNSLKKHLSSKEISLIVGPRQAGKTTLMQFLAKDLEKEGQKTVFLNLDFEEHKQYFSTQAKLLDKISLEVGSGKAYIFIDEIQRLDNAGLFLKGIFDRQTPYKFIVSGSGSLELKEKIHESLVGRKRIFELGTLNFIEFINYRTTYRYQNKLKNFFQLEKDRSHRFLEEYLLYGGYPRVVLADTKEEKIKILKDIYQSYLEKDISFLLGVKKTDSFTNLVKISASQVGRLFNLSEMSITLGLSLPTVKQYLWYLQKTFILNRVSPYSQNLRKEIGKQATYYFYDLGLRNYSLGFLNNYLSPENMGFIFQNFIYLILKDKLQDQAAGIHFWRTKAKAEVDFVVSIGNRLLPMEVKYRNMQKAAVSRSLHSFLNTYKKQKKAYIINLSLAKKLKTNYKIIEFIPYYHLFWQDFYDEKISKIVAN